MINDKARRLALRRFIAQSALQRLLAGSSLMQNEVFAGEHKDLKRLCQTLEAVGAKVNDLETLFEYLEEDVQGELRQIPGVGCPAFWACQITSTDREVRQRRIEHAVSSNPFRQTNHIRFFAKHRKASSR